VAVEGAEAAEVAAAAEVADAGLAAELAAEVVAYPGELAAGARPDGFPVTLIDAGTSAGRHGRVRQNRPGQSMLVAARVLK
jgi:hypothetical protein